MRTKEELDRLRERAIALRREGKSLRAKARELRAEGLNYNQITARLGVSKSSVSLWVRDLPVPPRLSYEENRRRSAEGARQYWATERKARSAPRERTGGCRRRNRRAHRKGDPHRGRHRLLVRRRQGQAASPALLRRLREQ